MSIRKRVEGDVTILEVVGKLTIGTGDVELRRALQEALDAGVKRLLLDLQGVKQADSAGIGELIRCKTTAARQGATLKLLHVEEKVLELLEMTRLIGVFETFSDETNAIVSFDAA